MKVLIVNNYLDNTLGGVENYLQALISFTQNNETNIEFKWFGVRERETKWYQKFYNAQTTQAIITEIDHFKPDIIHCFSVGSTVTPHFMNYAKSKNIPIVQSFHDYYYICPKGHMMDLKRNVIQNHQRFLECVCHHYPKKNIFFDSLLYFKQQYHKSIIKKNVSYFLSPSDDLTKKMASEFEIKGKTLSNPVVISNTHLSTEKTDYLLFVGRIEAEKGVLTLVKAFQKVLKNYPDEQLKIVGSGSYQKELESYVFEHNIKNVSLLGFQNPQELAPIYASAKYTIIPSELLESFGNVILESFSFNKTVIISDLLGIKNDVEASKSGLIYPYGDVQKLASIMEEVIKNSELRRSLEQNATLFVKNFSFENHLKQLRQIYLKLLQEQL